MIVVVRATIIGGCLILRVQNGPNPRQYVMFKLPSSPGRWRKDIDIIGPHYGFKAVHPVRPYDLIIMKGNSEAKGRALALWFESHKNLLPWGLYKELVLTERFHGRAIMSRVLFNKLLVNLPGAIASGTPFFSALVDTANFEVE